MFRPEIEKKVHDRPEFTWIPRLTIAVLIYRSYQTPINSEQKIY